MSLSCSASIYTNDRQRQENQDQIRGPRSASVTQDSVCFGTYVKVTTKGGKLTPLEGGTAARTSYPTRAAKPTELEQLLSARDVLETLEAAEVLMC